MAGECLHSTFLETALKQCDPDSSLECATGSHDSYLKIIGDLKNDLEQISSEVIMVQKECSDQHQGHETETVGFENSLKELETQNDRLQQALQLQTQAKEAALTDLQTNNETLKCQIAQLQRILWEKDQQISALSDMLKNIPRLQTTEPNQAALEYATLGNSLTAVLEKKLATLSEKFDHSRRQEQFLQKEARKLTEELNANRRKNRDLISKAHQLAELLKCQESHHMELVAKYETLEENYENQMKKLRAANNQLRMSEEKCQTMEMRQSEHNMECTLLREQVLSLKENLAAAVGRQKSVQDQLLKTEKELYNAHEVIKEQKNIVQRKECIQNEERRRWQEANSLLKTKLADLTQQHQKLHDEYKEQKEINTKQLELLENLRKWKEEQPKAEQNYLNIIRNMLEEKKQILANMHDLFRDYSLLQNELEISKLCPSSLPHCNSTLNSSARSIPKMFELVRHTTRRVSEQNSLFKDEEPNASRDDTSSAYRPGEEPI